MIFNISNFIELEQGPCNFYILNRNLIFFYHNFLGKLRYRKGGSKIFHSHEKYDGLLVLIWPKKCKKVEAYFTVIYKNTNHLYSGIHDKNSEILNIHYNTKILHMQKKVFILYGVFNVFCKKSWKKPILTKKMYCIIVQIQTLVSNCMRLDSGHVGRWVWKVRFEQIYNIRSYQKYNGITTLL